MSGRRDCRALLGVLSREHLQRLSTLELLHTTWILLHEERANHVTGVGHVLGAPAARGESHAHIVMVANDTSMLTERADARRDQPQCFRDSYARVGHEAIDLADELWTAAEHSTTCAVNVRIAHVACAWQTIATHIPPLIVRRQPRRDGLLDRPAPKHREFPGKHRRQEELCASQQHACKPTSASREHGTKKQCVLCATICWLWPGRTPVFLRNGTSAE